MYQATETWFDIWPRGGGRGRPEEHILRGVTLAPTEIGSRLLGRFDAYLSRERECLMATGRIPADVVFDATVWTEDGVLLWYGDIDVEARSGELQDLADAFALPIHIGSKHGRPRYHDGRLHWRSGPPVCSFHPTTDRCHPWAPIRQVRLPRSHTICYSHAISRRPVDWHPIGAALTPMCFLRFGAAADPADETPALRAPHLHPDLSTAVDVLTECTLVAIEGDELVLNDGTLSLADVIHRYVREAVAQILHEPAVIQAWTRAPRSPPPAAREP